MNKAISVLLIIAVAAGIVTLARTIKASSLAPGVAARHWIPTGKAQPVECPNVRHTPLYGI